jgi:hypothetical protein
VRKYIKEMTMNIMPISQTITNYVRHHGANGKAIRQQTQSWRTDLEEPGADVVSFAMVIRPPFRARDVNVMKNFGRFGLSKFDNVVTHADNILLRLKTGDMPCDGRWPPEQLSMFAKWIEGGKKP